MAHIASKSSNHIEGKAIYLIISWSGELQIKNAKGRVITISSLPKTGRNRNLIRVGRTYGVYKLKKDPSHWSYNGK